MLHIADCEDDPENGNSDHSDQELLRYDSNCDHCNTKSSIPKATPTLYDKINLGLNIANTILRLIMVSILIYVAATVLNKKFVTTTQEKIGTVLDNMIELTGTTIPNVARNANTTMNSQVKTVTRIEGMAKHILDRTDKEIDHVYNFTDSQMNSTKNITKMISKELQNIDNTIDNMNLIINAWVNNDDSTKLNHIIDRSEYITEHVNITKFTTNFYQLVKDMNKIAAKIG